MGDISAKLATIIDQILKEYAGACSDLYKEGSAMFPTQTPRKVRMRKPRGGDVVEAMITLAQMDHGLWLFQVHSAARCFVLNSSISIARHLQGS
jgi:hypothetical protein